MEAAVCRLALLSGRKLRLVCAAQRARAAAESVCISVIVAAELEAASRPIGSNDLLIAAHARALAATVVTANAGAFRRVPGLNVENWLE